MLFKLVKMASTRLDFVAIDLQKRKQDFKEILKLTPREETQKKYLKKISVLNVGLLLVSEMRQKINRF